ncbi:serine/threonine-protein kinase haspin [Pancytospora epiphaga]|nr:serine/threonine-protein kinase haspin [Pancytospora epiphaga]
MSFHNKYAGYSPDNMHPFKHKFGKYNINDSSSTEERILERFSNLKKRLVNSSLCRSFIIREKGMSIKVPASKNVKAPVLSIPTEHIPPNSVILEEAVDHTALANKRIHSNLENQELTIRLGDTLLADLNSSAPSITSSFKQNIGGSLVDRAIVELDSDILGFSSGILLNDCNFKSVNGHNLTEVHMENCHSDKIEQNRLDSVRNEDKYIPTTKKDSFGFSVELKALDKYYKEERRRIHQKYGFSLTLEDFSAIGPTLQKRKRFEEKTDILEDGSTRVEQSLKECIITYSAPAITPEELKCAINLRSIHFESLNVRPVKIAEASFSEVFRVGNFIYKIIPFGENYQEITFHKEIGTMLAMRHEYGVIKVIDTFILQGRYPQVFLDAWNAFPEPENLNPALYGPEQTYGCIVMEKGGVDLESYKFTNPREVISFFVEFCKIIYNLQEKFSFEHRDLHWGNILIKEGLVTIIDFSLSRVEVPLDTIAGNVDISDLAAKGENRVIYTDLEKEEWIFNGDDAVDEQFGVYKAMRAEARGDWYAFTPGSNGLWICYVIGKLRGKSNEFAILAHRKKLANLLERIHGYFLREGWGSKFICFIKEILDKNFRAKRGHC